MQVPSITDLREVFGQNPESVAEVSYGRMLPLNQWPDGEVLLTAAVADRTATVYLCPTQRRLKIQIDAPNPVVLLSFKHVEQVVALRDESPFRGLSFTIRTRHGNDQTFVLRTDPEIDFRSL